MDLGIATLAAFAEGARHPPINASRRVAQKKARRQRRRAGRGKYACHWPPQPGRMAQRASRIAPCRHDILHKLRTETSNNPAVIVREDVQGKHRLRSATGTVDTPGTQVAHKALLNKEIIYQ